MIAWGARERTTTDGLYLVIVIETAKVFFCIRDRKVASVVLREFYLLSKSVLKTSKNINSLFQSYYLTSVQKLCALV